MIGTLLLVLATGPVLSNGGATRVLAVPAADPNPPPSTWATASTLCGALQAGDKAGSWWCLKGDGAMLSGSAVTLSGVGSPGTQSWPVCPSGTGCTNETMTLMNPTTANGHYYASGNTTPPTGSFTTCSLGSNDQPSNSAGPSGFPNQPLVVMSDLSAGGENWEMYHSSNQTLRISCRSGAGVDCGNFFDPIGPVAIETRSRETALECAVFDSGVKTRLCTYYPDTGLQCVSFLHAKAAIDSTSRKWSVGVDPYGAGDWHGWFRGAFMTEKVLTDADLLRLAEATLPVLPTGVTFTRATKASCCTDSEHCVTLSPNVPCVVGGVARQEAAGVNDTAAQASGFAFGGGCDGDTGPRFSTLIGIDVGQSRFGLTTASAATFVSTAYTDCFGQYSRCYVQAFTSITGNDVTVSHWIKGYAGASGTTQLCLYDGTGGPNNCGYHCSSCSYNPTTWTQCSLTYNSLSATPVILTGSLSVGTGTATTGGSYYFTDYQFEPHTASSPSSAINTSYVGAPQYRATETLYRAQVLRSAP